LLSTDEIINTIKDRIEYKNYVEAAYISKIVNHFVEDCKVSKDQITVISPYLD
jgi:hypothetical protein